jgi:hypothetical protein
MDRRNPRDLANLAVLTLVIGLPWAAPAAAEWVAVTGDIGRIDRTAIVHGGVQYANPAGSELEKTDPGLGFEGGVAVYLLWNLSVDLSFAMGSSDVDGQVEQLLDTSLREDGRSATVQASVDFTRVRAGVRLDSFRQEGWRVQPYVVGAVVWAKSEVTVDRVDGGAPAPGRASFDSSQLGALARMGFEVELSENLGLDIAGNYEVLEFPAGTSSLTSVTGGFFYRI